ncbi:MAG: hypothetical protein Q8N23_16910 [Archangium sp.]|nr:hypothetical protein [Archangium sp.]MDP3154359.1 hypothetical protein [Archangium sp.]MDP3573036.1 hypothetical protein [Archangium sp.]
MKLKLFLGAAGLYVVAMAVVAGLIFNFNTASVSVLRRVKELGEKNAPLPTAEMKTLTEACAGKVTPGGPRSIAAYVAKLPGMKPSLEKDYYFIDEAVIGVHEVFRLDLSERHLDEISDAQLPRFQDVADFTGWSRHLGWARSGNPELRELQYLVVARYESLTMPVVADTTFEAGTGRFGARVLAFPSGDVVCEGRSEVSMQGNVNSSGRGATKELAQLEAAASARSLVPFVFTKAVVTTPLHRVCEAGGEKLCDLTHEWVGR